MKNKSVGGLYLICICMMAPPPQPTFPAKTLVLAWKHTQNGQNSRKPENFEKTRKTRKIRKTRRSEQFGPEVSETSGFSVFSGFLEVFLVFWILSYKSLRLLVFSGFLEVFLVFWILSYKSLRLLVFLVFLVFSRVFWFSGIVAMLCVFQANTSVLAKSVGFRGGGTIYIYIYIGYLFRKPTNNAIPSVLRFQISLNLEKRDFHATLSKVGFKVSPDIYFAS